MSLIRTYESMTLTEFSSKVHSVTPRMKHSQENYISINLELITWRLKMNKGKGAKGMNTKK